MSDNILMDSLFRLLHSLKKNLHDQLEALELDIAPMHVRVLKIISKKPQCTAVDIANFLDRDKAQVTRLISSLIKHELIVKELNPQDKRSQCLRVTQSGQAIMETLVDADKAMLDKMQQGISDQDLTTFLRVARQITSNLN